MTYTFETTDNALHIRLSNGEEVHISLQSDNPVAMTFVAKDGSAQQIRRAPRRQS